jgi:hypothetical protein
MKDGKNLIEHAINNQGFLFFEVQNQSGKTLYACVDSKDKAETLETLNGIYESLPQGRYIVIVGKKADEDNCRVLRGAKGSAAFEIPLYINNSGHMDVNSHNATAVQPVGFKEYDALRNEVERLKIELLKAELKAAEPKEKEKGVLGAIAEQVMQSEQAPVLINAAILGLTNLMSNLFIPPQQAQIINGQPTNNTRQ